MQRRRPPGRKNDVLYAAVMFAVFAVMVFNVAAEYFARNDVFASYFFATASTPGWLRSEATQSSMLGTRWVGAILNSYTGSAGPLPTNST
jgi:hypothetical protein